MTSTPRNEVILDQLAYLLDELDAQRPWLLRIPETQLVGKPMDSVPSLFELYQAMAEKEWIDHVGSLTLRSAPEHTPSDLAGMLDHIQAGRQQVLKALSQLDPTEWEAPLYSSTIPVHEIAFGITQSDSTFLRSIAERLHESMISFNR